MVRLFVDHAYIFTNIHE